MRSGLIAVAACLLLLSPHAFAHRLDEYLQAILLTVSKDRVEASMRLIPGVAVSEAIIAAIDRDGDGILSPQEQQAYAQHVLAQWSFTADGVALKPALVSFRYPTPAEMREGLGEIHLEVTAELPPGGSQRSLTLKNLQPDAQAAYLINSLVPTDPDVHITGQSRNRQQSVYRVDYLQTGVRSDGPHAATGWSARMRTWAATSNFASLFRLGVRHIAEGTDHLLFLLVLLLPAPLIASGSRWAGVATLRHSLPGILRIVTAFTLGHSITLALAAWGVVSVPARPVEVLIAVSILVSAVHAWRPVFPGKEAAIAAGFGLVHGLAFAATLTQLGLDRWSRTAGILAFNLGIEAMQLLVVAVTLPSLLVLSRTRAYPPFRIAGALFAGAASLGWIAERLFDWRNPFARPVELSARHAPALAAALFFLSLVCLAGRDRSRPPARAV